jgi:S-adenosylmethionine-diacylglycerol 3-amino-3-carboxypropyl transferase
MQYEHTSPSAQTAAPLSGEATSPAPAAQEPAAIPWRRYSGRISYSSCNEDSHSELEALRLAPDKRVLCVTAGGGRVLNLLHDRPREIMAVDVNPTQTYLLELKIEAMRALTYEPYLAFLGVRQARDRLAVYQGVRPALSSAARDYFDTHPKLVQRGVLFQGSLERFLVSVARIAHMVRPFWVKRLFSCQDVTEQRRFIEGWDTRIWRFVVETLCRRTFLELFSRDPGFWRFVPPEIPLHNRIFDSIHRYLCNHVARDSHLLQLVFFARYVYEPAMPIYLQPKPYERIRQALATTRITPITAPITGALATVGNGSFDAYSIADVSSYLSETDFGALMDQIMRTARPAARICSRGIFVHRPLPGDYATRINRDPALEQRLSLDDLAMVHEFLVGTVQA